MKKLEEYSEQERAKFDEMHLKLTELNKELSKNENVPFLKYTDQEMADYSEFRQLVLEEECKEK